MPVEDYLSAIRHRPFQNLAADESGMRSCEREAEKLLERVKREFLWAPPGEEGKWKGTKRGSTRPEIEQMIRGFICRYLLGRTAMDVSVFFTFVRKPSAKDAEVGALLRAKHFEPVGNGEILCRITVINCDAKSTLEIPEYAGQLRNYAEDWRRGTSRLSPATMPGGARIEKLGVAR